MRVLVPMDGSEQSWRAFEHAAEQFPDSTLVCLRVIDPIQAGYGSEFGTGAAIDQWITIQREAAEEMFEDVEAKAEEHGVEVETHSDVGRPSRTIVEFAEECDHVVVGSHGRDGISRILLGSVAETVVRRSPAPVTVVR